MTDTDPINGRTHFRSTSSLQEIKGITNKPIIFKNMTIFQLPSQDVVVADELELRVMNELALTFGRLKLVGDAQLVQTHSGTSQVSGFNKLLKV